jgi:hypothetical protein
MQPSVELEWLLPGKRHVVCTALAHRLSEASSVIKTIVITGTDLTETQLRALRMTIPCLRSIGNIATACQGRFVGTLLQETSILSSLENLLQAGFSVRNENVAAVAVEAAWAAGTLLCDAGIAQHPSTTIAAPALIPTLCQVIVEGSSKLDFKREAASALWNAVAAPPNEVGDASTTRPIRDEYLAMIAQVPGMIACLTELLTMMDADAVLYSISLLDAMLRRLQSLPNVKREFLEANGVDALEVVCERASQDHSYGGGQDWKDGMNDESAELAADLIDDLFSNEMNEGGMEDGEVMVAMPQSFSFSPIVVNPQQQTFNFGTEQSQTFPSPSNPVDAGRGRGRGKPTPSWMNQSP